MGNTNTSMKHNTCISVNTCDPIDIPYATETSTEFKEKVEEMYKIKTHYQENANKKYAQEESIRLEMAKRPHANEFSIRLEMIKKEASEKMKTLFPEQLSREKQLAKIRKVMGEKEWKKNNGHICNTCAAEAGVSLHCRCKWKCTRHSSQGVV